MSAEVQFHQGTCYRLTGQDRHKPVVVLIHGVGLNQDMWQSWIPLLSRNHDVLTYDLFGHGRSVNPGGPRAARDFVAQLMDLVNYLGMERFALTGFSLGAVVTQAVASLYGSRLTHAVFLHSVYQRTGEQCDAVRRRYRITRDQGPMATVVFSNWRSSAGSAHSISASIRIKWMTFAGYLRNTKTMAT